MACGIYVHLPFCPYICPYCDFAKWPYKRTASTEYLRALYAEIESTSEWLAASAGPFATVFLGGGTPNTYSASDIADVLQALSRHFPGPPDRETTIEVNPDLVTRDDLCAYRESGVNRLSIGVQSFVDSEVQTLGRRHRASDVQRAVFEARHAGISSVSIDLIFAVPGQTLESWRHSLRSAIELQVDHVSTYGLTIEAGTPYAHWREREPAAFFDDAREAEFYETAIAMLEDAGYEQYEISNFARAGHRSRHNANYWANGEYIGFGVGAASYIGGVRRTHTRNRNEYVAAAVDHREIPGQAEELIGPRRAGEAVMLALRTSQGVCFEAFKERYGVDFLNFYAPVVERYRDTGLLEVDGTHARLTARGRFFANDVCADFVTFA